MTTRTYTQNTGDKLDYRVDWEDWLGTDTILTSVFTATPSGLFLSAATFSTTFATIWIQAKSPAQRFEVRHTITTAAGRTASVVFDIEVR